MSGFDFDFDEGYDFDSPKHSSYAERWAEVVDNRRKTAAESARPEAATESETDND